MARRNDREYWAYLREEQRSQPGCAARELCRESHGRDTRISADQRVKVVGNPHATSGQSRLPGEHEMVIKRVGPLSCARIVAVLDAIIGLFIGAGVSLVAL